MTVVLDIVNGILLFIGALLMLIAAIGVLRLPDFFMRMAANTKAATLGAACLLTGLALHFLDLGIATRAIATVVFLFMTAPIAAHMLGRAAYITGVPLWEKTVTDELEERYDYRTLRLVSTRYEEPPPAIYKPGEDT